MICRPASTRFDSGATCYWNELFLKSERLKVALHFVNFGDERVYAARRIFGEPDFYHRNWDYRAYQESRVPGDVVVFATGTINDPPKATSWDDSEADIRARGTPEDWK